VCGADVRIIFCRHLIVRTSAPKPHFGTLAPPRRGILAFFAIENSAFCAILHKSHKAYVAGPAQNSGVSIFCAFMTGTNGVGRVYLRDSTLRARLRNNDLSIIHCAIRSSAGPSKCEASIDRQQTNSIQEVRR
jgi:hypothetical protein